MLSFTRRQGLEIETVVRAILLNHGSVKLCMILYKYIHVHSSSIEIKANYVPWCTMRVEIQSAVFHWLISFERLHDAKVSNLFPPKIVLLS